MKALINSCRQSCKLHGFFLLCVFSPSCMLHIWTCTRSAVACAYGPSHFFLFTSFFLPSLCLCPCVSANCGCFFNSFIVLFWVLLRFLFLISFSPSLSLSHDEINDEMCSVAKELYVQREEVNKIDTVNNNDTHFKTNANKTEQNS